MKNEALLFSTADIQWDEFVNFMMALQGPLQAHIEAQVAGETALHDIIVEKGNDGIFFSFQRVEWGNSVSAFEYIQRKTGIAPLVYISISDVSNFDLIMQIVYAFAQKWPCLLDYGTENTPSLTNEVIIDQYRRKQKR